MSIKVIINIKKLWFSLSWGQLITIFSVVILLEEVDLEVEIEVEVEVEVEELDLDLKTFRGVWAIIGDILLSESVEKSVISVKVGELGVGVLHIFNSEEGI